VHVDTDLNRHCQVLFFPSSYFFFPSSYFFFPSSYFRPERPTTGLSWE